MTASRSTRQKRSRRLAAKAQLVYINDYEKGYGRRRRGRGFTYLSTRDKPLKSARKLKRIEALAIPPAWENVWICPHRNGHVQARGVDEAGRLQYIYHERWKAVSSAEKFHRMAQFAAVLPRIRRRVRQDLNRKQLDKLRVVAAAVRLIDRAHLRVGDADYTDQHGSRGATTLAASHLELNGVRISLDYPGKSGKQRDIDISDAKLARVLDGCEDIGGQFLFSYFDADGLVQSVESGDVNAYLRRVAKIAVSAKDFRTWAASVEVLDALRCLTGVRSKNDRKRCIIAAVKQTALELGNTPAVARRSYIHPAILAAAETGELPKLLKASETKRSRSNELTVAEDRLERLLPHL